MTSQDNTLVSGDGVACISEYGLEIAINGWTIPKSKDVHSFGSVAFEASLPRLHSPNRVSILTRYPRSWQAPPKAKLIGGLWRELPWDFDPIGHLTTPRRGCQTG